VVPPVEPPPDVDDEPDDGALGVAAGAVDVDAEDDVGVELPLLESFFVEAYRSEYQPPPFSWKLERLIKRSRPWAAPHFGQGSGAGSLTFCITSSSWPHCWQRYS
jgi:hypothetical protein